MSARILTPKDRSYLPLFFSQHDVGAFRTPQRSVSDPSSHDPICSPLPSDVVADNDVEMCDATEQSIYLAGPTKDIKKENG